MAPTDSASARATPDTYDAIVIGAGFAGIYMVYRLREAGFTVHGFETGSGVGGTWYWNRYPGARCDSESMFYSYSFLPDLEQEWPLEERYPGQPEVLRYLNHVADRLDIHKHFTYNSRITHLTYDDDSRLWSVRTDTGEQRKCRWVVTAVGSLSQPNIPEIPGADSFAGLRLYTSRWPHNPVDLTGTQVGIIGTGASGIQSIPIIASQAEHLTVFQRTPQFTIPAANGLLPEPFVQLWKKNYREWRRRSRFSQGGVPYPWTERTAMEVTAEKRREAFEAAWEQGGFVFVTGTFGDVLSDEEANECAADFVRDKIDQIVRDPETAEMLKPRDYPLGTKRLPLDTNYYETFNRPNVTLVDLRRTPIERITPRGVQTTSAHHDLDVLVYATGFDALTGALLAIDITGRAGRRLSDAWAEQPLTYLGLAIPGFPNLLTITGPGSPSVLVNMPTAIEQHVEWIEDLIKWATHNDLEQIEPRDSAATEWTSHVQEVANLTLFPKAGSWYMGANIPGKPRFFLPYVGGFDVYQDKCNAESESGYEHFDRLSSPVASR